MTTQRSEVCGQALTYIMSPSYSGSTLLTFLLANHPNIATIGELKASALGDVSKYACSCGEKIIECGFWEQVAKEMHARGRPFSLDKFGTHFRTSAYISDRILRATVRGPMFETIRTLATNVFPACKSSLEDILEQNRVFIEVTESIQKAGHFLDGSKDPIRLKHFYDSGLWDINVICLVRDGRGVANSYMNHMGVSMEVAANEWMLKCREMQNVMSYIPDDKIITVHYEDLCQDVSKMLERICNFVGLDSSALPDGTGQTKHHILGNSMRLRPNSDIKLDEKWRRMLSDGDLQKFYDIGGDINAELGYMRSSQERNINVE